MKPCHRGGSNGRYPEALWTRVQRGTTQSFFRRGWRSLSSADVRDCDLFTAHVIAIQQFSSIDWCPAAYAYLLGTGTWQNSSFPIFLYSMRPGGNLFLAHVGKNVNQFGELLTPWKSNIAFPQRAVNSPDSFDDAIQRYATPTVTTGAERTRYTHVPGARMASAIEKRTERIRTSYVVPPRPRAGIVYFQARPENISSNRRRNQPELLGGNRAKGVALRVCEWL